MSHAMQEGEQPQAFTTNSNGGISTAKLGRTAVVQESAPDDDGDAAKASGAILPTSVRIVIYAVGTPVAAAASFVAGTDVFGPVVSTLAGAIAAAAVAAVGTTALGNLNR